jgi:hypothetical protein
MTDEQIKHMVNRFLCWKLPERFNPDNGISFDPIMNKCHQFESRREPSGTNLFDADQATVMVRHMAEGAPSSLVHVVLCMEDGGEEVRHIFSTREKAEAFMNEDGRKHIYYDYALDCPQRHEGVAQ